MITRITNQNSDKYTVLFNKASRALGLPEGSISSLNLYFSHLHELRDLDAEKVWTEDDDARSLEQMQRIFLRLPIDEEAFVIDANTRAISIPQDFARNGISVQSDEMAEVLYFVIDRYYDTADLAGDNVNIAIQWEAKNEKGETIQGMTKNFGKDIESLPGKVIFGWPIYSKLTAAAGNVSFAVRFYTIENDKLLYSFSTLPATVQVKASLAYDVLNLVADDNSDLLLSRPSGGIYNIGDPIPAAPTVTDDLSIYQEDKEIRVVDLPADGEQCLVSVEAKASDAGALTLDWYKEKLGTNGIKANKSTDAVYVLAGEDFIREHLTGVNYYVLQEDGSHLLMTDLTDYPEEDYDKVYRLFYVCDLNDVENFPEGTRGAGKYTVKFKVQTGVNSKEFWLGDIVEEDYATILVPYPEKASIDIDSKKQTIAKNHSAMLAADAITRPEGDTSSFEYKWFNGDEEIAGERSDISVMVVPAEDVSVKTDEAKQNQNRIYLTQEGNSIKLYRSEALNSYASSDAAQGEAEWVAIDLNTHLDTIVGVKWNGEELSATDIQDALDNGLGAGHIVYWAKFDALVAAERTIVLTLEDDKEVSLTFKAYNSALNSKAPVYNFNKDASEMYIYNIPEKFNEYYALNVISTRNYNSTDTMSDGCRITNNPIKPELYIKVFNSKKRDYEYINEQDWEQRGITINGRDTVGLRVAIVKPEETTESDKLTYAWFKVGRDNPDLADIPTFDYDIPDEEVAKLGDIFSYHNAQSFYDADESDDVIIRKLKQVEGTLVDEYLDAGEAEEDKKGYQEAFFEFADGEEKPGMYYCVVVNELNGKNVATVSPFIWVN